MRKRIAKKKFNLTNKEINHIINHEPHLFKHLNDFPHGAYIASGLDSAIFFWKGKRVSKNDYYKLLLKGS